MSIDTRQGMPPAGEAPPRRRRVMAWVVAAVVLLAAVGAGVALLVVDRGGGGQAGWLDEGVDGAFGDEVAGQAVASARGRAVVLA